MVARGSGLRRLTRGQFLALGAGAGLVLAALCADGTTEVWDVEHIDRGYPRFVENLRGLGAGIERVTGEPDR